MISEFPTFLRDAFTHSQPNVAQTLSVPSSRRRILYLGRGWGRSQDTSATNEENEEIHPPVICHMMENG